VERDIYTAADDAFRRRLDISEETFRQLLCKAIVADDQAALAQIEGTTLALSEYASTVDARVVLGGFAVLAALVLNSAPANTSRVCEAFLFATEIGQRERALVLLEREAWRGNTDAIWAAAAIIGTIPKLHTVIEAPVTDTKLRDVLNRSTLAWARFAAGE
jgi:hypothetical protein